MVLSVGQWWRLLGVLRPSGGLLCVSEAFVSEAWGASNTQDDHKDDHTGSRQMLRQGHVMITSDTSAFIPAGADI